MLPLGCPFCESELQFAIHAKNAHHATGAPDSTNAVEISDLRYHFVVAPVGDPYHFDAESSGYTPQLVRSPHVSSFA